MVDKEELDCLLVHVPKMNSYYKPIDTFASGMSVAMGLFAIADLVSREGYKTQIFHLGIEKMHNPCISIEEYIKKVKPKVVGLSLHWSLQSYDVIETARQIKTANPEIFIVLGGYIASYFYEEIMNKFIFIDGVIRGDGDIPFLKLIKETPNPLSDLSRIPNLIWRKGDKLVENKLNYVAKSHDLDELNFTNFKLLKNYQLYIKYVKQHGFWLKRLNRKMNTILLGSETKVFPLAILRGCFLNCAFCPQSRFGSAFSGRRYAAMRSIEKVIESIKEAQKYGYNTIYFEYLPLFHFEQLFYKIKNEKINISAIMECVVLPLPDAIQQFKDTFLNSSSKILFHLVASEEHRKMLLGDNYFADDELKEILNLTNKLKIRVDLSYHIDMLSPKDGIKVVKEIKQKLQTRYIIIMPAEKRICYPGSQLYEALEEYPVTHRKYCFMDLFYAHKSINQSYFTNTQYSSAESISNKNDELQKFICKDFCRLGCYLSALLNFSVVQREFWLRIFNFTGRLLCKSLHLYWKITK